jgi:hypothetical protein
MLTKKYTQITHPKIKMKKQIKLIAAASAALVITGNAATMTVSNSAPTVDGEDQNNYATTNGLHKFWAENSGAGLTRGQTFTTGAQSLVLSSFSYRINEGSQGMGTKVYNVRVGTITEALGVFSFGSMLDETATQTVDWLGTDSKQVNGEDDTRAPTQWGTFVLDAPVTLAANTEYGVDLGMASTTTGWQSGIPYLARSLDNGPVGDEFSSGVTASDPGQGNTDANFGGSRDMVYHLNLSTVVVPEPTTTALLGLGGLALIFRRRK